VWQIKLYESENGKRPVEEFILSLDAKAQAKLAWILELLEQFGVSLGMPYAKHLEKQLWELRVRQTSNQYRIIYFLATGQTFVLLHGFTKKTVTVPREALNIARHRRDDYISRGR
jgi:phage-related protein